MDRPTEEALNIRIMVREDVPDVYKIETQSFARSTWTIEAFYHEVSENNFARYFVMEYDGRIIGYIGLWIVIDQAQVTNIAIDPTYRGLGLGQLLMQYAMQYATHTCDMMSLEVRIENDIAQHIYSKLGFQYGGKRKDYYGKGEDAMVMWVELND